MEQMIVENVQTLVEHAARTNDTSRRMSLVDLGKRLLEMSKRGDTDAVRALMSNGAPFTTDWLGTSPLHFSAQHGHQETAQVLLRAGISRDARTKVDRTPLHVACQEGHVAIVQLLLQSNADIDAKDMLKMTPLHWATEKGHIPIIGILIRNGADITLEDKFSRTPIDIALANGRTDIAQLFQIHEHTTGVIEEGDTITIETPDNLVTETVCTSDGVDGLVIDTDKLIKAEPDDSTDQTSTSVLATLAALAEATAPNSGSAATTSEAMSWLESHGITMISGDGSLITSAVESGQTITLTEAGKIALNQIIQQDSVVENDGEIQEETIIEQADGGDAGQNMITLVTSGEGADGIEEHHQVQGTIVTTEDGTEILVQNTQGDVMTQMTDEDGNALVIEEANGGLAGVTGQEMVLQEAEGEVGHMTLEGELTLPEHLEEHVEEESVTVSAEEQSSLVVEGEVVGMDGGEVVEGEVVGMEGEVVEGQVVGMEGGEVVGMEGEVVGMEGEVVGMEGEVVGMEGEVVGLTDEVVEEEVGGE